MLPSHALGKGAGLSRTLLLRPDWKKTKLLSKEKPRPLSPDMSGSGGREQLDIELEMFDKEGL